jgi:putative transposase
LPISLQSNVSRERVQVYNQLKDNKRALYDYKYKSEKDYKLQFEWMKEVDAVALQYSRIHLSQAYTNFSIH